MLKMIMHAVEGTSDIFLGWFI